MATATIAAPPPTGLTEAEAARRLKTRGPLPRPGSSRSYLSIVRANVLTVFNLILAVAGAVTLIYGQWQDALFLGILVLNTAIGIFQEVRAKRALDRLAALVAPTATVVRDGAPRRVGVEELVVGDLVRAQAGDQIVADGTRRAALRSTSRSSRVSRTPSGASPGRRFAPARSSPKGWASTR